ncbi:MAG: hypothetical protein B9S33_16770 [Pedosphaera sp. Tous-C6FEB]|nr:MAG: hypothetical protein B9S33_16770 [Pedosphaera sp. Tous-C6FEB]
MHREDRPRKTRRADPRRPATQAKAGVRPAGRKAVTGPRAQHANAANEHKISPGGVLPTGEKFTGVADFRSLLIARHEQFARSLTEKLLTYALGREPAFTDRAVVLSESFGKN